MKFPSLVRYQYHGVLEFKKQTTLSCGACCRVLLSARVGSTTLHKFSIKVITHMPSSAAVPKIAAHCLAMKSQKCPAQTRRFIMQLNAAFSVWHRVEFILTLHVIVTNKRTSHYFAVLVLWMLAFLTQQKAPRKIFAGVCTKKTNDCRSHHTLVEKLLLEIKSLSRLPRLYLFTVSLKHQTLS